MGHARKLVVFAAAIILSACAPPSPLTRPAGPPPEVPPTARPEPAPTPPAPPVPTPSETAPPAPAGATYPEVEEAFQGEYRAAAKTEYATIEGALAPFEYFSDLGALAAFLQPQIDPVMRSLHPHLTGAVHRVEEERHNVTVDAYIHAVKHESGPHGDRDFHVMLGSSPMHGDGIFMTAEASGLPTDGADRLRLAEARRELLAIFGTCRCNNRFMQVSPPIRVRVTGSLFFDGDHGIGSVGPAYAKPFSVWEIHPILAIERLLSDGVAGPAPQVPDR